ncbi:MotE family protein [Candidatus Liberibacter sp.]|uniref:MotE family protein n=1 Tax=Candidatus Liberibacter sp. TaxID=34022 RepID=UPI0021751825|nr:MotE family protein [Candidatus Liberibacter sp.]
MVSLIIFFLSGFVFQSHGEVFLPPDKEIQKYCTGAIDLVREQHYFFQKKALDDLQKDIEERIAILEKRKNEYSSWFEKYENFITSYGKNIINSYKTMPSDSAAGQLAKLSPEISAHILMQLPDQASSIMSEMDPESAALITNIVASFLKFQQSKRSK